MITTIRILQTKTGYEALVYKGLGECRLINTDTLDKLLKEISNCQ